MVNHSMHAGLGSSGQNTWIDRFWNINYLISCKVLILLDKWKGLWEIRNKGYCDILKLAEDEGVMPKALLKKYLVFIFSLET